MILKIISLKLKISHTHTHIYIFFCIFIQLRLEYFRLCHLLSMGMQTEWWVPKNVAETGEGQDAHLYISVQTGSVNCYFMVKSSNAFLTLIMFSMLWCFWVGVNSWWVFLPLPKSWSSVVSVTIASSLWACQFHTWRSKPDSYNCINSHFQREIKRINS